jgi:hypothetical protein
MGCLAVKGWQGTTPGGWSDAVSGEAILNADAAAKVVLNSAGLDAANLDNVLARVGLPRATLTGVLFRVVLAGTAFTFTSTLAFSRDGLAGDFLVEDARADVSAKAPRGTADSAMHATASASISRFSMALWRPGSGRGQVTLCLEKMGFQGCLGWRENNALFYLSKSWIAAFATMPATRRELAVRWLGQLVPVLPKPPMPLVESGSDSTSCQVAWVTGARTAWAIRMPLVTVKGS